MIGVEAEIESNVIELEASLDYRGPRGPQGIQGIQGEQGIQGIQGVQGEIGPSGVYVGEDEPISDYDVWIDPGGEIADYITHEDFLKELNETIKEGVFAKEQGDYAKETTDTLKESAENGDFNGATFKPSVDSKGNLSWTNDKGLENPATQNIKGDAALVNGVNTLKIVGGQDINIEQNSDTLKINNTYEYDDSEIKENTNTNTSNISKNKADIKAINDNLINYSLITETGSKIELSINPIDFKMKVILKDKDGNTIDTSNEIDLPLESMVIGASYDSDTKELVITLQNGTETRVPMSSLVDGLVNISDLDNYVKVTDYASNTKHGLIRGSSDKSWSVASNGTPYCSVRTLEIYNNMDPASFVSKGTLENIKDNYVETAKPVTDINDYIDVITPKNTVKDSLVHIEDALPLPIFESKAEGRSHQNTTNGYQLLNVTMETQTLNGVTFTVNEDKSITIKGTATNRAEPSLWLKTTDDTLTLKAGTIYYNKTDVPLYFRDCNGAYYGINSNSSYTPEVDLTLDRIYIRVEANQVINTTIYPMLTTNATAAYEQFTGGQASPNINYPQAIENISGSVNYKGIRNNFLDCNELNSSYTNNGITFTNKGDGTIVLNGTATDVAYIDIWRKRYPAGTYTLSGCPTGGSNNTYKQMIMEIGTWLGCDDTGNGITRTFDGTSFYSIRIRVASGYTCNNLVFKPMLRLDSTENSFELYQEAKTTISIPEGEFVGKLSDNAKDDLLVDKKGNVSLDKCILKKVFDGTENWFKSGLSTSSVFVIALDITNLNINFDFRMHFLSNHFKYDDTNIEKNKFRIYKGSGDTVYLAICFDINEISTLSDAIAWLKNNQLELEFVSNNVETIQLEKLAEPIKTFEGINNIQVLANLDTEVEVKYALDIKKYIDRQNNLQDTQINEINILLSSTDTSAMLLDNYQNDLESEV